MFERPASGNLQASSAAPKKGFSADAFRRLSGKLATAPEATPQEPPPKPVSVAPPPPAPPVQAPVVRAAPAAAQPPPPPRPAPPVLMEVHADAFMPPEIVPPPKKEIRLDSEQLRKSDLARALIDLMSTGGSSQPQEKALATDTLLELLPDLRGPILTTLSERVAMMEAPPAALVTRLVMDNDLVVASPLLEEGLLVTDQDLIAVIYKGHPDKLRLIARRRRVSRAVSEAIAAAGDQSAMLTLIRNQGAEFSINSFTLLMHAAKQHAELLAPLCTRPDLPPHLAFELFWFTPPQLRRFLMSRFLIDTAAMSALLKIKMDVAGGPPFQQPDKETLIASLAALIGDVPEQGFAAVALCARVKPATVARIAADSQGEALMALFKVMGIPRSEVGALIQEFAAGAKPLLDPSRDADELQAIFDQLSFNKARLLLTYWDWSLAGLGPYAKKA